MDLNQSYSPLIAPLLSNLVAKIKSRTFFRQIISGVFFNAQKESGQNARVHSSYNPDSTTAAEWNATGLQACPRKMRVPNFLGTTSHSCGYPLPVYNSKSLLWKGYRKSKNWIFNRQIKAVVLELTCISVYSDTRCYNDDSL